MNLLFHEGLFGINQQKIREAEKHAARNPGFAAEYGEIDYVPNVWLVFYAFRFMMFAGLVMLLMAFLAVLWKKDDTLQKHPKFLSLLLPAMLLPYIANTSGWVLAEVGRQPWIVYGLQTVNEGVSEVLKGGASIQVLISLLGFTVIYSVLTVVAITLVVKFTRAGLAGISTKPATAG
jgi:cytochrome d ubiquinol oxidase subunit I